MFFKKKIKTIKLDSDEVLVLLCDAGANPQYAHTDLKNIDIVTKLPGRHVSVLFSYRRPRIKIARKKKTPRKGRTRP